MNNINYYAIIPASVRYDKDLPANAKLMYGEITALTNEKGFCWASNTYFSELYGAHVTTISRWIRALSKKGFIKTELIKTKTGSNRKIFINNPLSKNANTPPIPTKQKCLDPISKNANTPLSKNANHNNIDINIKEEYKSTTTTAREKLEILIEDQIQEKEKVAAANNVATLTESQKVELIIRAIDQQGKYYTEQAKRVCTEKGLVFVSQLRDYAMYIQDDQKFPLDTMAESDLQKRFWSSCNKVAKKVPMRNRAKPAQKKHKYL